MKKFVSALAFSVIQSWNSQVWFMYINLVNLITLEANRNTFMPKYLWQMESISKASSIEITGEDEIMKKILKI